ncbi:hypothetical protein OIU92_15670 [Escherichia coli]|nr:hypothetical protein [Escherichia coli]
MQENARDVKQITHLMPWIASKSTTAATGERLIDSTIFTLISSEM